MDAYWPAVHPTNIYKLLTSLFELFPVFCHCVYFTFSGDTLDISVVRTWEFNQSFPLRSVVVPKLLFQPFFTALLSLSVEHDLFHLTGYLVLVSYRLIMVVLTLWIDYCIFRICSLVGAQGITAALLLASSYVTLTFQTHTFSNSLETVFLVTEILILVVLMRRKVAVDVECAFKEAMIKDLEKHIMNREKRIDIAAYLHRMAYRMRRRAIGPQKRPCDILQDNLAQYQELDIDEQLLVALKSEPETVQPVSVSLLTSLAGMNVLGFFNRPTFVLFAVMPLLLWLHKVKSSAIFYKQMIVFILASVIMFGGIVITDSVYFSSDHNTTVSFLTAVNYTSVDHFLRSFTITPLNFFYYNMAAKNLEEHGLHPRYLHALVNLPLLFGPLVIPLAGAVISQLRSSNYLGNTTKHRDVGSKTYNDRVDRGQTKVISDSKVSNISKKTDSVLKRKKLGSVDSEVDIKVRDCLNILLIFIPLIGLSAFPHQEPRFLIPLLPVIVIIISCHCRLGLGKIFLATHIMFNMSLSIIFGIFHQGGVVPCMLHLQNVISHDSISYARTDVVFSSTYMPPKHLLLLKLEDDVHVHDLKGQNFGSVCDFLKTLKSDKENGQKKVPLDSGRTIYFALTGTLVQEFNATCGKYAKLKLVEKFFPHLSFEDPPNLKLMNDIDTFFDMFSLHLYQVSFTDQP